MPTKEIDLVCMYLKCKYNLHRQCMYSLPLIYFGYIKENSSPDCGGYEVEEKIK